MIRFRNLGENDPVVSVNLLKTDGVYEVKVLKTWKVTKMLATGTAEGLEMVLIDFHEYKIGASIPPDVLSIFEDKIIEGCVYKISCVNVSVNNGDEISTYHSYKFVFNKYTKVEISDNALFPSFGLSLITVENITVDTTDKHRFLIDVIGVVISVQHDRNFYPDETMDESVTFNLADRKKGYLCELKGDLMEEFRSKLKDKIDGLPIVVLQFVKITISQGELLIKGVNGITRLFVEPSIPEVINFRTRLVMHLSENIVYKGLSSSSTYSRLAHTVDFVKGYSVKTIAELKSNPDVGIFFVNARICDVIKIEPWWYAICKCPQLYKKYIGDFECTKCVAPKFIPSPRVRFTFEVDDESGLTYFTAFDHVLINMASGTPVFQGITVEKFYEIFNPIMGKSIMFIVKKSFHNPNGSMKSYEMLRATDHEAILSKFDSKGYLVTPSKPIGERIARDVTPSLLKNFGRCTTTIEEITDEYRRASAINHPTGDIASTSGSNMTTIQ